MEAGCVRFYDFGSPRDCVQYERKPIGFPGAGKILVRMLASPVNPSDLIPITGAYAHRTSLPAIPGYEGVGIVIAVGRDVSPALMGKRVLPLRGEGTWQEYVTAPAEWAVPVPDEMDDYTAAQLYINPVTAWVICTEILKLGPGDTLVVNAAGSALGRILAQFSKMLGFRLIAVTRNNYYTDELLRLGASHVIDTATSPLYDTVMELTKGEGATAAIDSIGGPSGMELSMCLRRGGTFVTLGLLSGIPLNGAELSRRGSIDVKLFHLRHWNQQVSVQTWQSTFNAIISTIMEGQLSLMTPAACYPLTEIREAVHAATSPGRNMGKIMLSG
ncbi:alcohol dehydrogenase [Bacillus sp. FJAT-27264]|uniref:zinc-dependent alcohol dehydrogenase family protein n=1 Tax=Paenibacillus sp. (strain DSM 101736 / FJAT-27264) TaxID=1850362 RepID=UPI000807E65F|nr:zinc-dependent alcohol dehydrogenase family protein [Bacillus sp. FJAT-27264]OBZ15707.1 alcohol dehydrogenase [Bacillus sp. FJAT-27264]